MLTEFATISAAETAGLTTGDVCIVGGRPMYCMPPCQADADPIWVPWSYRDSVVKAVYKGGTAYNASPNDAWSWVLGTGTPAEAGSATTLNGDTIYANWTAEDIDRPMLVVADVTITAGTSTSALLTLEGCGYSIGTLLSNGTAGDLTLDTSELADYAQGTTRAKIQLELDPDADVCELRLYQTQALIGSAALSIASGSSNDRISVAADTSTIVLTGHPALVVYQRPYVAAWYDTCDDAETALSPDAGDYCYIGADRVLCRWAPGSVVAPAYAGGGADIIVDGDMELTGTDNWPSHGGATVSKSTVAHAGTYSVRYDSRTAATRGVSINNTPFTVGVEYAYSIWFRTTGACTFYLKDAAGAVLATHAYTTGWEQYTGTFTASTTEVWITSTANLVWAYVDDVIVNAPGGEGSGLWLPHALYDRATFELAYKGGNAYNALPNSTYSWDDVTSGAGAITESGDDTSLAASVAADTAYLRVLGMASVTGRLAYLRYTSAGSADQLQLITGSRYTIARMSNGGEVGRLLIGAANHSLGTGEHEVLIVVDSTVCYGYDYQTMDYLAGGASLVSAGTTLAIGDPSGALVGDLDITGYPAVAILSLS